MKVRSSPILRIRAISGSVSDEVHEDEMFCGSETGDGPLGRLKNIFFIVAVVLGCNSTAMTAQSAPKAPAAPTAADNAKPFDPHDLSGVWRLPMIPKSNLLFRSKMSEPELTPYGKAHLYPGGITHGTNITVSGGFPGQNCDPIAAPAQFSYLRFYPIENIQLPGRIHQLFELHREWRDIWIDREHSKDPSPTYMGESVAKWEGNTLVVDTIGYNGKDFVTEDIDHPMSKEFRLVERYTRTIFDTLTIEMAFYDPIFWGDKPWTGFTRVLKKQDDQLQEWICVPEVDSEFNRKIMKPTYGSTGLNGTGNTPKK